MSYVDLIARPIDAWPDQLAPDHDREQSRFSATWSDTVALLRREVDHLGGVEVVLQLAVSERECRRDGWIRADARPRHPGVIVSFDSDAGSLRFSTDRFTGSGHWDYLPGWQANVRAVALGLEALRKVDRYGIGSGREQYVGWGALPPATPMGAAMTIEEAQRLLDVEGRAAEDVHAAWRLLAKQHHPDAGGDAEDFRRLTQARDLLLAVR